MHPANQEAILKSFTKGKGACEEHLSFVGQIRRGAMCGLQQGNLAKEGSDQVKVAAIAVEWRMERGCTEGEEGPLGNTRRSTTDHFDNFASYDVPADCELDAASDERCVANIHKSKASDRRYSLECELSASAGSTVHRAVDKMTRRVIVLKERRSARAGASGGECSSLAGTSLLFRMPKHENCVEYLGACPRGSFPGCGEAISMEFVDGPSIERIASEIDGPFEVHHVIAVVRQALAGLDHLHGQGIAHGNVSMGKILIDSTGTTKLCGIDSSVTASVRASRTPADDIWSLGCVAVFMLGGRPPRATSEQPPMPFGLTMPVISFLSDAFLPADERPTASELLGHPLFSSDDMAALADQLDDMLVIDEETKTATSATRPAIVPALSLPLPIVDGERSSMPTARGSMPNVLQALPGEENARKRRRLESRRKSASHAANQKAAKVMRHNAIVVPDASVHVMLTSIAAG